MATASEDEDVKNTIYKLSYEQAIEVHKRAVDILGTAAQRFKKGNVRKIYRKMFERQLDLHKERLAHLEDLKRKGSFDTIVLPPSGLDIVKELIREDGDNRPWTLSQIRKALKVPSHLAPFVNAPESIQIPFFALTLSPSAEVVTYRLSHSSELLELGVRSYWWFVKDPTNTHTLYAAQAIWRQEIPIVEAILRRSGGFLPKWEHFRLITSTIPAESGQIVEIPDGEEQRKNWSPRRFSYSGRRFVWKSGRADGKSADGGIFSSFEWETLYETKRVLAKNGSRTGKMEDETVGPKLCWGEKRGANGAKHTIYMPGGLDLHFREHLLAAQLARLIRGSYPPQKDSKEFEAVGAASSIIGLVELLS
ncbi:hypothetical protein BDW69DRAFT_198201 [Aspergillus filifer]